MQNNGNGPRRTRPDLAPDRIYTSLRRKKIEVQPSELPYWDGVTKIAVTKNILQTTVSDTNSLCNLAMWDGLTPEEFEHALVIAKVDARKYDKLCGMQTKRNVNEMLITCLPTKDGTPNCFIMPATGSFLRQFAPEKPVSLMELHRKGIQEEVVHTNGNLDKRQREEHAIFREEIAPVSLRRQTTHQPSLVPVIDLKKIPRIEI